MNQLLSWTEVYFFLKYFQNGITEVVERVLNWRHSIQAWKYQIIKPDYAHLIFSGG